MGGECRERLGAAGLHRLRVGIAGDRADCRPSRVASTISTSSKAVRSGPITLAAACSLCAAASSYSDISPATSPPLTRITQDWVRCQPRVSHQALPKNPDLELGPADMPGLGQRRQVRLDPPAGAESGRVDPRRVDLEVATVFERGRPGSGRDRAHSGGGRHAPTLFARSESCATLFVHNRRGRVRVRVAKGAGAITSMRLDAMARASAAAIRAAGDPGVVIPRFLIRLADHLQPAPPATEERHQAQRIIPPRPRRSP
jgi:hypothetical protein